MTFDLREFVEWIVRDFEPRVRVDGRAGAYARTAGGGQVHLYGTADMACIFYTLDLLPRDEPKRAEWIGILQSLQDPASGYLAARPADHSVLHNTAFALGALNLLGALPRHPLSFAREVSWPEKLVAFLDGLDWRTRVYRDSHDGAGLASAVALVPGTVGPEWFEAYFAYTDGKFDPANGMMGVGKPACGDTDQVGGTFHYAFLYEHFRRPIPCPEARTEAILRLQLPSGNWRDDNPWWLTMDAMYLLDRDQRRTDHRRPEVRAAMARALAAAVSRLKSEDTLRVMTPHTLTAVVSLLAVAQQFFGGEEICSPQPLRLVLDRRPFI